MKINELLVEEASSNSLSSNSETSIEEETSDEMGNEGEEDRARLCPSLLQTGM